MTDQLQRHSGDRGRSAVAEIVEQSRHGSDTFFLETLDALTELGADARDFAHRHGLLLLKPDAAVTGAMRPTIVWLRQHGYRVVAASAERLTYLHLRSLWYFNWDIASAERRRLADQLAEISPALVLVLTHEDSEQPASVRLTEDKGPANPAQRAAGELRWTLGLSTYLLNQVHSADEPDDVLRELSIYFPWSKLLPVLGQALTGRDLSQEAIRLAEEIESSVERKGGGVEEAQNAVWAQVSQAQTPAAPTLENASPPQTGAQWLAVLDAAHARGVAVDPWYRLVLESAYLPMRRAPRRGGSA